MDTTTTFDDYDDLADYVEKYAPYANLLPQITAQLGDDHAVWLDRNTVLWAWKEPGRPGNPWYLDQQPASSALDSLREQLNQVLDRLADPSLYQDEPNGSSLVDCDEDVLDELYTVELAAINTTDPRDVDRIIQARIRAAQAEVARLAGLRVHHIYTIGGSQERGWQNRAARAIGVTEATLSGLLAAERERQARRRTATIRRGQR